MIYIESEKMQKIKKLDKKIFKGLEEQSAKGFLSNYFGVISSIAIGMIVLELISAELSGLSKESKN